MLTLFHSNDQKPGNSFCGLYSLVKLGNAAQTHEIFITLTNGRSTLVEVGQVMMIRQSRKRTKEEPLKFAQNTFAADRVRNTKSTEAAMAFTGCGSQTLAYGLPVCTDRHTHPPPQDEKCLVQVALAVGSPQTGRQVFVSTW